MFIARHGDGPHHYLGIHGWSGDHRTFAPLVRDLPPHCTFWSVDLPGCGKSPPPEAWSLDAVAHDLVKLVDSLPDPLHVVANCSGALLALKIAPQVTFAGISLIDAFAWWPWYFRVFLAPGVGRYAYMTAFANPVGRWVANLSLSNRRSGETDLTEGFARVNHDATYRYLRLFREMGTPEELQGATCPIDICYGERTFRVVKASARRWKAVFPQAKERVLRGAGHLPILEATSQLRDLLFEEKSCLAPPTNYVQP